MILNLNITKLKNCQTIIRLRIHIKRYHVIILKLLWDVDGLVTPAVWWSCTTLAPKMQLVGVDGRWGTQHSHNILHSIFHSIVRFL